MMMLPIGNVVPLGDKSVHTQALGHAIDISVGSKLSLIQCRLGANVELISKRKLFVASVQNDELEPTCFSKAFRFPVWQHAMSDEFTALIKQGTWELQPLPPGKTTIGCKWVYRIKRHPDESVARHKARLVAQGYHQE